MKKKKIAAHHDRLESELLYLKLTFISQNYKALADEAAKKLLSHIEYLDRLICSEVEEKRKRAIERRIRQARFPVIKTLDNFRWTWPKKINRLQVQNIFNLNFMNDFANVIFLGGVGLGKSHLAAALGRQACLCGHSVLFSAAIDVINSLTAAQSAGKLKQEMKKYLRPSLLILDELGYLPLDKVGADLLF